MATQPEHDRLSQLADVVAEDVLDTSSNELLAEVAEDHGDPRALAAEFDRLVKPMLQSAEAQTATPAERRPAQAGRSTVGRGEASTGSFVGWLKQILEPFRPRGGMFASGGFQLATASLVGAAFVAGAAFLIVREVTSDRITRHEASAPARTEGLREGWMVVIAEGQSEEEARTNYRAVQSKYPSLLADREPLIRARAGTGDNRPYRAVVGPFATMQEASQFCDELNVAGARCSMANIFSDDQAR